MGAKYILTVIHLNTGAEKGGVCSLRRGRLMSRWVSSKLTSVSDRASPGQAFYHQSSIIRSPSKTHKETDSKAASQTKNKGSKADPPDAALHFTTVSPQPCYFYGFNFTYCWSTCCWPCCVLLPTPTFSSVYECLSRGVRMNIAETHNCNPSYSSSWVSCLL